MTVNSFIIDIDEKKCLSDASVDAADGFIKMGDFEEYFESSLSFWTIQDYFAQWIEGLERLIGGDEVSALVTSMHDPDNANFIFWWILYRVNNVVYVQNHVLFLESILPSFEIENLYQHVPKRETHTDEGELISEWVVDMDDVKSCLLLLKQKLK